ncbi:MAG TPA: NADH-quinone oxidoreductase subunit L [Rhodanobacteraceae bacterium]|nr:NADH-quinone oxidoreductase subunit L [Rhodanobacteraceae bacterium]
MTALALVPLAPFVAALAIAAFGKRLPARGGWLAVLGILIATIALPFFFDQRINVGIEWFTLGHWHFGLSLHLDGLSWALAMLVAWVALAVNVYAVRYMRPEAGRVRFHAWMTFFVASMLTLILAGSLLLLFIAWEGVGVASYALIAQRHEESEAQRAALKAFLMTRLGDFGLLLGWLMTLHFTGTTDIATLLNAAQSGSLPQGVPLLLAMLFLAAAIGKSAQLPLTAWLPDAMAGPTPVSALIHSATMVAAGVYLVTRLFPLFAAAPPALEVVLWIGGVTAVLAALAATAQADLKRILAWSTVSQLGEMFIALGLGAPIAATFHLITHAAFKACLFLGAGAVERATGSHELGQLGGLYRRLPWITAAFVAAALSLAGLPPFSGYWSEERILAAAAATHAGWAIVLLVLIALAGVYIGRATMATFGPWRQAPRQNRSYKPWIMLAPTLALAIAALALGGLVHQPIGRLLPFAESPPIADGWWKTGAIIAGVVGLAFGVWRTLRGPVPALGKWPGVLGAGVHRLADATAHAALSISTALCALERGFDRLAQRVVAAAWAMAQGTRIGEDRGLWVVNDGFAEMLGAAGERLRPLESGKVFWYSAGVFGWTLLAGIAITLVVWWL